MSSTGQVLLVHFDGEGAMVLESKEALGRELMQGRPGDKCQVLYQGRQWGSEVAAATGLQLMSSM